MEVFIVGGGSSLKGFDFSLLNGKDTIAVNKSVFYLNNPTYFITLDYTFESKVGKERLQQVSCPKFFVAQKFLPYLKEKEGRLIDTRLDLIYDLSNFDVIVKSYRKSFFGTTWNAFATCHNSGAAAIQLAILLGYKTIYLLGLDYRITGEIHFHEGYGQAKERFAHSLEDYAKLTLETVEQWKGEQKIISCSPISILNAVIPYIDIKKILASNGGA